MISFRNAIQAPAYGCGDGPWLVYTSEGVRKPAENKPMWSKANTRQEILNTLTASKCYQGAKLHCHYFACPN